MFDSTRGPSIKPAWAPTINNAPAEIMVASKKAVPNQLLPKPISSSNVRVNTSFIVGERLWGISSKR